MTGVEVRCRRDGTLVATVVDGVVTTKAHKEIGFAEDESVGLVEFRAEVSRLDDFEANLAPFVRAYCRRCGGHVEIAAESLPWGEWRWLGAGVWVMDA